MMKIVNVGNTQMPFIFTETNMEQSEIIAIQGIMNLNHGKKDERSVRTLMSENKDNILKMYNHMQKKPVERSEKEYLEICDKYINTYQAILHVKPDKIRQTPMKLTHLGWAYKNNTITLNKYLMYMNEDIIQHVICHEMCHIFTLNYCDTFKHNDDFYEVFRKFYTEEEEKAILAN